MQRIHISHSVGNIPDGQGRQAQKLCCLGHPVGNQKFLWCFSHILPEDLSEIAAIQTTEIRNIFHRDIILKILFNKGNRFLDIEILQSVPFGNLCFP